MENEQEANRPWYKHSLKLLLVIISGLFIAVFGGSMAGAWLAVEAGALDAAANIATFASAVATFALVAITAFYAYSTWLLVDESKQSREQDRRLQKQRRQQKKEHLRRALRSEILTMRPFLAGQRGPEDQFLRDTIYKNNSEDIGILSQEEVEAIISFYGTVTNVQRAIDSSDTNYMEPPNAPTVIMETEVQKRFNSAIEALDKHIDAEDVDPQEEKITLEAFQA